MNDTTEPSPRSIRIEVVRTPEQLAEIVDEEDLVSFLHRSLVPFEDEPRDIRRGIRHAIGEEGNGPGFVLLALEEEEVRGALVMLDTGMSGFVPENLLLYLAVDPDTRGSGIGGRLCRTAVEEAPGQVALHVEYDNPARRLYERLGFETKYAEMRHSS